MVPWGLVVAIVVVVAALAIVAKVLKVKRLKFGSVEVEPTSEDSSKGRTDSRDAAGSGLGHAANVSVERNRFGGDVGDISGVKQTLGEPRRRPRRRSDPQ